MSAGVFHGLPNDSEGFEPVGNLYAVGMAETSAGLGAVRLNLISPQMNQGMPMANASRNHTALSHTASCASQANQFPSASMLASPPMYLNVST